MMRGWGLALVAGCATASAVRIADLGDLSVYVVSDESAHHSQPISTDAPTVRAALLQDGALVDAQVTQVAPVCARELGRIGPAEAVELRVGRVAYRLYAEDEALLIAHPSSGATTRFSLAAPPRAVELLLPRENSGDSGEEARAHAIYLRAIGHYNLGELADALDGFKEVYRAIRDPALLFNIAQCHRRLRQNAAASEMYRAYLRQAPDAANRPEVERLIKDLTK